MDEYATRRERMRRRLDRQFDEVGRLAPMARGFLARARSRRVGVIRIPLGLLLVVGGVFSILPFLGLWMLPLGLLLLSVDIPALRPAVTTGIVRLRRRASMLRRRLRRRSR